MIMVSVFVAFIPAGTATIQQIAFGLAVGVFVDAFVVRMTLVPAVMVLLDKRAWWLPRSLDRRVPVVDVEGAALHRKIEYEKWEAANGAATLLALDLVVHEGGLPVQLAATPGRVNRLTVPEGVSVRDLGHVLVGRQRAHSGELVVDGRLLPEQREAVNRMATLISPRRAGRFRRSGRGRGPGPSTRRCAHAASRRRAFVEKTLATMEELERALSVGRGGGSGDQAAATNAAILEAASAIAGGATVIVLTVPEQRAGVRDRELAESLAAELARRGLTVVLLGPAEDETEGRGQPGREPASVAAGSSGSAQEHAVGSIFDE